MRDYGTISPKFWTGKTGKAIRKHREAQVLALYLMTSPHSNMIGLYHVPVAFMSYETGLEFDQASKGLQTLIEIGFCEYDEESETVFVLNMAKFQVGPSLKKGDKRVIGIQRAVEQIADSPVKDRFFELYSKAFFLIKPTPENDLLTMPLGMPHRSQEQEQEQEQDQEQEQEQERDTTSGHPSLKGIEPPFSPNRCPHQKILDLYSEILPELPTVLKWTDQRKRALSLLWKREAIDRKWPDEEAGLRFFRRFFVFVKDSKFLMGQATPAPGRKTFVADVDFLFNATNFVKIIEGKYS